MIPGVGHTLEVHTLGLGYALHPATVPAVEELGPALGEVGLARVGHRLGVHAFHMGIERGVRNPSLRNIAKLCRALGVPLSTMFKDVPGSR